MRQISFHKEIIKLRIDNNCTISMYVAEINRIIAG